MVTAPRILLVDDNPHDRGMIRRELRHVWEQVQFLEVTDTSAFSAALEVADFSLVITDFQIRWTDGLQVLRAVKKRNPYCPVVMCTATGSEEIAVEAMKAGLDDYVIKNEKHFVRLRGTIQAVLEHAETRRRADELQTRLHALLAQLDVGAFSCTTDGRLLDLNDTLARLLDGNSVRHSRDLSLTALFPSPNHAETFFQNVVRSGIRQETELSLTDDAGGIQIYRLTARRMSVGGPSIRIDGLVEDITLRKQYEAEARQAAIAATRIAMLSPREQQVFKLVAAGRPNKSIAIELDIGVKTVEKHRASMMKKLQARTVTDLVRLATLAERTGG